MVVAASWGGVAGVTTTLRLLAAAWVTGPSVNGGAEIEGTDEHSSSGGISDEAEGSRGEGNGTEAADSAATLV